MTWHKLGKPRPPQENKVSMRKGNEKKRVYTRPCPVYELRNIQRIGILQFLLLT